MSAAFGTVCRHSLNYKLVQTIPLPTIATLINNMLNNHTFQVVLGNQNSTHKKLKNRLIQGSLLAPLVFSQYLVDVPDNKFRTFGYADLVIASKIKSLDGAQETLIIDLNRILTFGNGDFNLMQLKQRSQRSN